MPGKEIKGRSKIANYRHGGRTGKQFGGPLTQPLVQPGVAQPGVAQPLARPGVAQPGVMPVRPRGFKGGGDVDKYEELGRVDAEKAFTKKGKKNLKAEKKRIVKELKT
jgi:hypothetical protein